jgi:hypothetical protein
MKVGESNMAEQEVTLRTKYRYKPENGDKYLTLYFENGSNDVIIDTDISGVSSEGQTTLTDAILAINTLIQQRALQTVYDSSKSLKRKNITLAQGQFGIESDTLQMKVGDGLRKWRNLPYLVKNREEPDIKEIIVDSSSSVTATIDGTEVTLELQSLKAAESAPEGATAFVKIKSIENDD